MLHDPEMECTCENEDCRGSVFLPMTWSVGGYDLKDEMAEDILRDDHNWLTVDGKHFCETCRDKQE